MFEAFDWVVVVGSFLFPFSLTLAVYCLGGAPPENKAFASQDTAQPPRLILWFTGIVCVGVLANCTVILPSAGSTAESAGGSLTFSGYMVGAYSLGGLAGLFVFARLSVRRLRCAYLLHAACMLAGNATYTYAAVNENQVLLCLARVIVGLEGGCMYNTTMAIVHFARGAARTPNLILYQLWLACGVTLGPPLNSVSMKIISLTPLGEKYEDIGVNLVMSIWGAMLALALLLFFPSDLSTDDTFLPVFSDSEEEESSSDDPDLDEVDSGFDKSSQYDIASFDAENAHEASAPGGLVTALILMDTAASRMIQRLLWESGAVVILSDYYNWGTANAGFAIGAVGLCNAMFQLLFAYKVAGKVADATILYYLEIAQIVGVLFMFTDNSGNQLWSGVFMTGSIIAYCSNQVWGGVSTSFCLKRAVPGTLYRQENLVLLNQASLFIGIAFGSVVIRILLDNLNSQNVLAVCLLLGSLHQKLMSYVV